MREKLLSLSVLAVSAAAIGFVLSRPEPAEKVVPAAACAWPARNCCNAPPLVPLASLRALRDQRRWGGP